MYEASEVVAIARGEIELPVEGASNEILLRRDAWGIPVRSMVRKVVSCGERG